MNLYITHECDEYFDVTWYDSIDDSVQTGLATCLTIVKKESRAYLTITGSDNDKPDIFYTEEMKVPLHWATKIALEALKQRKGGHGTPKLTLIFKESKYHPKIRQATHARIVKGGELDFSAVSVFELKPGETFFMEGV